MSSPAVGVANDVSTASTAAMAAVVAATASAAAAAAAATATAVTSATTPPAITKEPLAIATSTPAAASTASVPAAVGAAAPEVEAIEIPPGRLQGKYAEEQARQREDQIIMLREQARLDGTARSRKRFAEEGQEVTARPDDDKDDKGKSERSYLAVLVGQLQRQLQSQQLEARQNGEALQLEISQLAARNRSLSKQFEDATDQELADVEAQLADRSPAPRQLQVYVRRLAQLLVAAKRARQQLEEELEKSKRVAASRLDQLAVEREQWHREREAVIVEQRRRDKTEEILRRQLAAQEWPDVKERRQPRQGYVPERVVRPEGPRNGRAPETRSRRPPDDHRVPPSGLNAANLNALQDRVIAPIFASHSSASSDSDNSDNSSAGSSSAATATRKRMCSNLAAVFGDAPLPKIPGVGWYFRLRINTVSTGWVGGFGIGVTLSTPLALAVLPDRAKNVPRSWIAGYWGRAFANGHEQLSSWQPQSLKAMDEVGFLVNFEGECSVYVNDEERCRFADPAVPVKSIPDIELTALIDVSAAATSVTFLNGAPPPPSAKRGRLRTLIPKAVPKRTAARPSSASRPAPRQTPGGVSGARNRPAVVPQLALHNLPAL